MKTAERTPAERTPEVNLREPAPDRDGRELRLSRAQSREGVPLSLMRSAKAAPAGPGGRQKREAGRPPMFAGLCAGGRGMARQSRMGDDVLVWFHSHGNVGGHLVGLWLLRRLGPACKPWQAAVIVRSAMDVVQRGRARRIRYGNGWRSTIGARHARMRAERFYTMRDALAYWLALQITRASARYRAAVSGAENETSAPRHNRSREVTFPTGPVFLRKRAPIVELKKAA
jgi:hypothetical protein